MPTQVRNIGQLAGTGSSGLINYYYEDDTTLASCTFQGNLGGSASAGVAIKVTRVGRLVTLDIPTMNGVVPTSSSTLLQSNTALPTWARPAAQKVANTISYNNGAYVTTTIGIVTISTGGTLSFYRDAAATAYTNSANAGWYQLQLSYSV